jgi:hypothetical protein
MTTIVDWQQDLTREKSLWQVYRLARRFRATVFNTGARLAGLILLTGFCVLNEFYYSRGLVPLRDLADTVRSWADEGISFGSQVLGFLVAGFTIFATMTKPALFRALAQVSQPKEEVSCLKFIFFNFMLVFIHYVSFVASCILIKMFGTPRGLTTVLLRKVSDGSDNLKAIVIYFAFVGVGLWFLQILILLKSFVWNVYQSVVLSVVYEGDCAEKSERELASPISSP